MKNIFCILMALMFLISAYVASFGSVCIDDGGFHVDLSTRHHCCESENVTHCDTDDDCFDLALELDVSRQNHSNEGPDIALASVCIALLSFDETPSGPTHALAANPDWACLPSSPLAALRRIRLLV